METVQNGRFHYQCEVDNGKKWKKYEMETVQNGTI